MVESLLNANPKLATLKDDDERLPIHWAVAYNHRDIVEQLVATKNFDPDVEDGSGWTPLMIATSLKNAEGDPMLDLLLRKGADATVTSNSGQVIPSHLEKPSFCLFQSLYKSKRLPTAAPI
ncbi:hypothetical protein P168DRAFT_29867 [Aspergillus campestris IBT 28561]|uniref:Uncharacterized protein n=1 Tax=Aspergillus campestris (strain IBT 28561) TaxID=1392248 RepID=A0A2I1DGQ0_ASPC2|nr:uncharacterized protein P168DRAFT_29867 [Aspergillus campestris IBT 28561]PKY09052.1 hypothetical protein P168DRAFT_29867 [Aspergillus campestris IBT 28561]